MDLFGWANADVINDSDLCALSSNFTRIIFGTSVVNDWPGLG